MASVLRTGLANLNSTGLLVGLCKITPKRRNVAVTQVAQISGRELRRDRPPRPPPYDWKTKKYGIWAYHTDPMLERFDDNTKLVVVEGLPAVGKNKFAKKLAEALEMKYVPPPSFDDVWINPYGFDLRTLNPQLPTDCQFFDIKSFLEDPKGRNSIATQLGMFYLRTDQYCDALAHILSTGEGVVIQRTPWSDFIFTRVMAKTGLISKVALDYYKTATIRSTQELMRPHLVIYLDAPVSVIKDNIKKRNIPYEVNSKALTDEYLEQIDCLYKDHLRESSKHAHLLIYDWSREGDIGIVVEDIERLDFDESKDDEKFHDWKWDREYEIKQRRYDFADDKETILAYTNIPRLDTPEMIRSAHDAEILQKLLNTVESEKWSPGFNPKFDKGILFKLDDTPADWMRRDKINKKV